MTPRQKIDAKIAATASAALGVPVTVSYRASRQGEPFHPCEVPVFVGPSSAADAARALGLEFQSEDN